jgi:magnesium-protoporphyrin IX monomethyl ester (oxidative) cyclase
MARSITKSESARLPSGINAPVQETLLTPRFYTTNFDAIAQIDLSGQQAELIAPLFTAFD